jgi:glycosyltransferase involved in cell wall biosynthesis
MKILIFSWRDIKNPEAGGSEKYFHEMAKRWVKEGHQVDFICGGWKGCLKTEVIDGITSHRAGGKYGVYFLAPITYLKLNLKPDVIIDVENGIPFFTPLYSSCKKRILHIHHIHKEIWDEEMKFPLNKIGQFLEKKAMPLCYKYSRVITVSESSREEIIKDGYFKEVYGTINPGVDFPKNYEKAEKSEKPSLLFLNRIKKYKGLLVLLKAMKILQSEKKTFDLFVAGEGEDLDLMKEYVKKNNLKNVSFLGRVSEQKKYELMQKSWIFINPSFKEGWGIVNIEANYFSLPVIGTNTSGIKDSIVNNKTGILFNLNDEKDLAEKISLLVKNEKLRKEMAKEAKAWSGKFSWDKKAKEYLEKMIS